MKLSEAKAQLRHILQSLETGCSNNGCVVAKRPPGSMGTNAICQCTPYGTSKDLVRIAGWMGLKHEWEPEEGFQPTESDIAAARKEIENPAK